MPRLHWSYRKKLNAVLDGAIPDSCRYNRKSCATFHEVIDKIQDGGKNRVYASGGLVRDIISGVDVTVADVDIKFGRMGKGQLKSIFDDMNLAMRIDSNALYTYFFVGCDPDNQLEGFMYDPTSQRLESPGNSLMVDLHDMTLLDPTGLGVEDAKKKVWRIPPGIDRDKWFDSPGGPRLLWRMCKFKLRGYKVPDEDARFIYTKFAGAMATGKVRPADYRNLINQVPIPVDIIPLMLKDAEGLGVSGEVGDILGGLVSSGEVWKQLEAKGNVPYQMICKDLREGVIKKREQLKKQKRKKRAIK